MSEHDRLRVLIVDNYDSFTYNLAQELGELGVAVEVLRNDAFTVAELTDDLPDGVVISPGPGDPSDAGLSNDVVRAVAGRRPLLGVCLGHQCIAEVYGGRIVRAPVLVHGKTSAIYHRRVGVFAGLPVPFDATRYHSLVVDRDRLPPELRVTAETSDGLVMALVHRQLDVEGVQFHPESVLTGSGMQLLGNWVRRCDEARTVRAADGSEADHGEPAGRTWPEPATS
jgi:anthranilate synthase/aminodeoxychorismate synthase-like glutamine amidotransferase